MRMTAVPMLALTFAAPSIVPAASEVPTQVRHLRIPNSSVTIRFTDSTSEIGSYAVALDGQTFSRPRPIRRTIRFSAMAPFDPTAGVPTVPPALLATNEHRVFVVQFVTQPLEIYRSQLRALGVTIYKYLADHSYLVAMNPGVRTRVEDLPYVRWVGPLHPFYKLPASIRERVQHPTDEELQLRIQVFERGIVQKAVVAKAVESHGGRVESITQNGFVLEATLPENRVAAIAAMSEVQFIDRTGSIVYCMDNVREVTGAAYVAQTVPGFEGADMTVEVCDNGFPADHVEYPPPSYVHNTPAQVADHATHTYGIIFAKGIGLPTARGMLPEAAGIICRASASTDRHAHTAELLQPPYHAVLQTNSWGICCIGEGPGAYTTYTAALDDAVFQHPLLILHASGNRGASTPFPIVHLSVAKNIITVGGVDHLDTASLDDDVWNRPGDQEVAIIGPASDGRVKPDLIGYMDSILTTSVTGYDTEWHGTSAATPQVAGACGLFIEMWARGVFGNPVDPKGTIFSNRPGVYTTKAMMINTARQYPFDTVNTEFTRHRQGWGIPNLRRCYDLRDRFLVVDETDILTNLESSNHDYVVPPGATALRATLAYPDPAGVPDAAVHRINDLTLRLTAPDKTVYYGNLGLNDGPWSSPGGGADVVNTVENVFVNNPQPGMWQIEVLADEINEDGYLATPAVDTTYGLVVHAEVPEPIPGDINCDSVVDAADAQSLVTVLLNGTIPGCDPGRADMNDDGKTDAGDIASLVACLLGECP